MYLRDVKSGSTVRINYIEGRENKKRAQLLGLEPGTVFTVDKVEKAITAHRESYDFKIGICLSACIDVDIIG